MIDYNVMTPDELQASKLAVKITSLTIPADGKPVVNLTATERHNAGVKGMAPAVVSWRFALLKLDPAGTGTAAGYADDSWVSYMAANDHSTASTETASTTTLTDNGDGTYVYKFAKNVTAGPTGAGTTYEPDKVHRLIILISASGNPFTPVNLVRDFIPTTGAEVTEPVPGVKQSDKVDPAACLECHTTFRAIAGGTGELGGGEFHGGARFDVHTCAACHNNQRRFSVSPTGPDSPTVLSDQTWPGAMVVMNNETIMNFPVFIHKIHMGERLTMTGMKVPPFAGDPGGTYQGYPQPYVVTFPQDVRNCVKCHRSPAPLADNYKDPARISRRTCGACHDDRSFVSPAPVGRTVHSGGPQADDNSCTACHNSTGGIGGDVPSKHIPVSPPNPNNVYLTVGGNSSTNAAYVAAAGAVPPGAHVINYVVNSVSKWTDSTVTPNVDRPQIVFKFQLDGADVVFPTPPAPGTPGELIPGFVGGPSAYFAFAVPEGDTINTTINAPADFNATGSAYIRNVWNGTGICSGGTTDATHTTTGAGILTGPDASGFYTIQLTCVVIPANAVMLTGGIGYTYSLGSTQTDPTLNFINNNLPFTQVDLPAYPYTPNDPNGPPNSRLGGRGGLIVPALDVSKVATGYSPRRSIVSTAKCAACHVSLGVGPDFHAGQRNDAATCNFCHNPNQTSSAWSGNQKNFVHSIHGAEKRLVNFTWHEVSATQGYWQTTYPAVLNRCTMCHLDGTFDFSTDAMNAALPNMLPAAVGVGTYAAGSVHSPYVAEGVSYGSGFSFNALTGASTQPASTTLIVTPIASACSACHDTPAAIDHMQTNGAGFWESRTVVAGRQQGEQCLICHGPDRIASISLVHTDKTP